MNLHTAIVERNTAHGHLQRQIQYTIELLALRGFTMESRALHEAMHNYNDLTVAVQDCILRDARVLDERHISRPVSRQDTQTASQTTPRMTMTRASTIVSSCPEDMKTRHTVSSASLSRGTTIGRTAGRTSSRLQVRA